MILPGTYQNGFAPRDGEPLFPELWRGCVGAWNPGLGASGLTLRDWSPYKNHGTLTNMDAGTAWVASQGRYALDFDGLNDYLSATISYPFNTPFTIAGWFNQSALTDNKTIFSNWRFGNVGGVSNHGVFAERASGGLLRFAYRNNGSNIFDFSVSETYLANAWNHIACTYSGSIASIALNGVKCNTTASATAFTTVTGRPFIAGALDPFSIGIERHWNGGIGEFAIYGRAIALNEIRLLASRRGIAYEMAPRSWSAQQIAAYRARYYSQVIGSGVI